MKSRIKSGLCLTIVLLGVSHVSCLAAPAARSALSGPVAYPSTDSALPGGSLLGSGEIRIRPARESRTVLSLLSPCVIGMFMKLDTLDSIGYSAWREARRKDLVGVVTVPVLFSARLPEGGTERQSGMIYMPEARQGTPRALTWVIFLHPAEISRDAVPSRGKGVEAPLMRLLAALGYAVWAPDYAGMGGGAGVQEFCVPASLAASALDGLAAARAWLAQARIDGEPAYSETGRYAIIGYSEGGNSALATLAAATNGSIPVAGLTLTAAYPMAGLLNLMSSFNTLPVYKVFFVVGWARAYPREIKPDEILLPGILKNVVPLFDGNHTQDKVANMLVRTTGKKQGDVLDKDIFTPEYLAALRSDPASVPYYRIQNAEGLGLVNLPSGVPIVLAAAPADTIISFPQIEDYYQRQKSGNPAADVTLVPLSAGSHLLGAVEGLMYALRDLDRRDAGR